MTQQSNAKKINEATKTENEPVTIKPFTGNEAFAQGAWEAGVKVAAAYPGTPSTEILENVAKYPEEDIYAQWSTNEKTSLDVAIGASFAGVRAFCVMKHVGVNVASDALMSQTYIGVNAGLVLVVCDDPGIHSSQNEQDTRMLCQFAMIPALEPSDAQEALEFTRLAFDVSEQFDTPVIVRSTTRLSHTRSPVQLGNRVEVESRGFVENPTKNVMIPSNARTQHPKLVEREEGLREYFETSPLTRWEKGDTKVGIITMGTPYTYVKEVMADASVLKLAGSYPLPEKKIREFAESVDRLFIVEELEPVVETQVKAMGLAVQGKEFFSRIGEFSPELIRAGFAEAGIIDKAEIQVDWNVSQTIRPPVLCSGCPHTSSYMALRAVNARVAGDIGCYTLSTVPPLQAIDTCVSMGSSIANAIGMSKAGGDTKPIVATIGDSTFFHSGVPPLIDAVYNDADITIILLDNHVTGMTGGQDHPGTGLTIRGKKTHQVDYEEVVKAIGVKWVKKVDSYDMAAMYQTFREAIDFKGVSVVISDRPCVLDPLKIKGPALEVRSKNCTACQACMNLGCPAISWSDEWYDGHHKVEINPQSCMGCTLCAQICPSDCIQAVAP